MSKRFINTKKSIEKRIKEGIGRGEGSTYKPWLKIQDVSSYGRSHRIWSCRRKRIHHFLSDLEERIFYLYDWSDSVIDIREQFPLLPHEETIAIAEELGIKHSTDPNSQYPAVITTDFLLKADSKIGEIYLARTAKYSSALKDNRTLEKFEIERVYWKRRNIDWKIVTEKNLPMQMFHNIKWVYRYFSLSSLKPLTEAQILLASEWITSSIREKQFYLYELTAECDKHFDFTPGTSINIVRHLIARKIWRPEMRRRDFISNKVQILKSEILPSNSQRY